MSDSLKLCYQGSEFQLFLLLTFLKMSQPRSLFRLFRPFKQTLQFLKQINVQKCPSSISGAGIQTHNLLIVSLLL